LTENYVPIRQGFAITSRNPSEHGAPRNLGSKIRVTRSRSRPHVQINDAGALSEVESEK